MPDAPTKFYHLHMVSDASGETLLAIGKAAAVQYNSVTAIKHLHAMVRNREKLDAALGAIEASPGIVLYTIFNADLSREIEARCLDLNVPCVPVLRTVLQTLETYLGAPSTPVVAGQHNLDAEYFRRIEAMNFTMMHDDSQHTVNLGLADIVLVGISRTSKTPTSIYLANRGFKTANVSLVPDMPLPPNLESLKKPMVVGLIASAERISDVRRNRLLGIDATALDRYVDKRTILEEIAFTKRVCARNAWPMIDVTRRSIEETAAEIIKLVDERRAKGKVDG
ncbi:MAG: pyruvate, water dikinase regulatory protein [Hyphomicrobiales bacterium]|nr:pyruvate, water dikinase regulatory protein [Hyphomicrobiales bacterium]